MNTFIFLRCPPPEGEESEGINMFRPPPRPRGMSDDEYDELLIQEETKFFTTSTAHSGLIGNFGQEKELELALALGGPNTLYSIDPSTGNTALHLAAKAGKVDIVQWLLKVGAKWYAKNHGGKTAYDLAVKEGHDDCAKVLDELHVLIEYENFYQPLLPDEKYHPIDLIKVDNEAFLKTPCGIRGQAGENIFCSSDGRHRVMSRYEEPIMYEAARLLMGNRARSSKGYRFLNVGYGLGIIDQHVQGEYIPSDHVIIEAHPDAIRLAQKHGYDDPFLRVFLVQGTWREIMQDEERRAALGKFDAIYFDTFEEGYRDHMQFWSYVPSLLRNSQSRFSFFHGVGQKSEEWAELMTTVATMHLRDLGLMTTWTEVEIDVTRKQKYYPFGFMHGSQTYKHIAKVPLCMLAPTVPRRIVQRPAVRFTD